LKSADKSVKKTVICAGGAVYSPALTDFVIMLENTGLMSTNYSPKIRSMKHWATKGGEGSLANIASTEISLFRLFLWKG
jgi:hypothetical protein